MKKTKLISLFTILVLSFFLFNSQPVNSEGLKEVIVVDRGERPNLVGFIPLDHQPQYKFLTVNSAKDVMKELTEGRALIGFLSPEDYLKARSKNIPLVALSSPFQDTPIAFAIKDNVFMRSYSDLKGKRVLYEPGSLGEVLFRQFLRQVFISYQDLTWVSHDPKNHKDYQDADIVIVDTFPEIVKFKNKKDTDFFIYPYEFGIYIKGPIIVTTQKWLQSDPLAVKRLVDNAIGNFQENIFNRKNIYSLFLQESIPYVYQPGRSVGEVTERDWWQMQRVLLEEAVLDNPVLVEEVNLDEFSLSFKQKDVTKIALPGLPEADFAGFYLARDKGYYNRLGRTIAIEHLPSEADVISEVKSGKALIGVVSSFSLLEAQLKNPEFRLLGVIFQNDPTVFISLEGSGGKSEAGVIDEKFLITDGARGAIFSLGKKKGSDVREAYPTPFALIDSRAKIISGRNVFRDKRLEPYRDRFTILEPKEFETIGLSVFTTVSAYEKHKNLIEDLLKFTYHGYENSFFQIGEAVRAVLARDGSLSYLQVEATLQQNKNYLKDKNGIIGSIFPNKWETLADAAFKKEYLTSYPDLSHFFSKETLKRQSD